MILYGQKFSTITPNDTMAYDELERLLGIKDFITLMDNSIYIPASIESVDMRFDNIDHKTLELFTEYEQSMWEEDEELARAGNRLKERESVRLHFSKFFYGDILDELVRRRFVKIVDRDKKVLVEKQIALKYMCMLAEAFADSKSEKTGNTYFAATSHLALHEYLLNKHSKSEVELTGAIRMQFFEKLAVPNVDVPLEKILEFCDVNKHALYKLEILLEQYVSEIVKEANRTNIKDALELKTKEIIVALEDLKQKLDSSYIVNALKSFALFVAGGEAMVNLLEHIGATVHPALPLISGGVSVAVELRKGYVQNSLIRKSSPMEYLYLAERADVFRNTIG